MENNNNCSKTYILMFFYFLIFGHLLLSVSSSKTKWDFNKGGQDWSDNCQNTDQAPIDISKPFEYKSKNFNYY